MSCSFTLYLILLRQGLWLNWELGWPCDLLPCLHSTLYALRLYIAMDMPVFLPGMLGIWIQVLMLAQQVRLPADTSSQIQQSLLLGKTFFIASTQHQGFLSSVMANLAHFRQHMVKLSYFPLFLSHNPIMERLAKHIPVHLNNSAILPLPPVCWIIGLYHNTCLTLLL